MPSIVFQVLAASTERLDRFLAEQLAMSRTAAARLLSEGAIYVNHVPARASRTLEYRDLVRVEIPDAAPRREITPHHLELRVVFEDDVLIVIDKPAGLVVHPAPGHWDDTLVNALAARGGSFSSTEGRPGIVHRLDKDTSGLLIIAKTDDAHRKLSHALGLRRIEREYAALIWGHLKHEQDIDAPIARSPKNRQQMAIVKGGRAARTLVQPVARFALCDLIRAKLFSGRTHQIRVHLAHIGHPVIGDSVYGAEGHRRMTGAQHTPALALERATPRQALHAATLRFAHPETREWLEFQSDWPDDLQTALGTAAGDETLLARPKVLEYLGFRA